VSETTRAPSAAEEEWFEQIPHETAIIKINKQHSKKYFNDIDAESVLVFNLLNKV
jgi:hypothetical protein